MFDRKFRRRATRRASRPAADHATTASVRVRVLEAGPAGEPWGDGYRDMAAGLPGILFDSMPMRDASVETAREWCGNYAHGTWKVAACAGCGARLEVRPPALRDDLPPFSFEAYEAFMAAVRPDAERIDRFRAAHARCEAASDPVEGTAVPSDAASPWGIPASVPESVRRWTDESLTLAWAAAEQFTGTLFVLLRRANGAEETHVLTFDHGPVPDGTNALAAQLRASLDGLLMPGDRAVAVAVSMYRLGTSDASETRVARALCLANEAGVFVGRVGADGHAPVTHHGCSCADSAAPVPQWFAAAAPSALFDGLITAS